MNLGMLREHSGGIVLGVERERDQPDLARTIRKGTDSAGELAEFPVHERAEIGKRASCINKRKYNHVTLAGLKA